MFTYMFNQKNNNQQMSDEYVPTDKQKPLPHTDNRGLITNTPISPPLF